MHRFFVAVLMLALVAPPAAWAEDGPVTTQPQAREPIAAGGLALPPPQEARRRLRALSPERRAELEGRVRATLATLTEEERLVLRDLLRPRSHGADDAPSPRPRRAEPTGALAREAMTEQERRQFRADRRAARATRAEALGDGSGRPPPIPPIPDTPDLR